MCLRERESSCAWAYFSPASHYEPIARQVQREKNTTQTSAAVSSLTAVSTIVPGIGGVANDRGRSQKILTRRMPTVAVSNILRFLFNIERFPRFIATQQRESLLLTLWHCE